MAWYKFKYDGEELAINSGIKNIIDFELKEVAIDDDLFVVVIGQEGSGKTTLVRSTLAPYVAYKMKSKYDIRNIHFNVDDYMEYSLNTPKYTPHILDESRRDLSRGKRGGKKELFNDFVSECRDQNQIHFIILPDYTSLDRDIAKRRLKILIEVVKVFDHNTNTYKRFFKVIKLKNKKKLNYYWEKRIPSFTQDMVYLSGKFKWQYTSMNKAYKEKKMENKKKKYLSLAKKEKEKNDPMLILGKVGFNLRNNGFSWTQLSNFLGQPKTNCERYVKKWQKHLENTNIPPSH